MKVKCGKFFLKDNHIKAIPYSNQCDYYKFVQEYSRNGYFQVVMTSSIMLEILKKYFIERKFNIVNVEFMEEDRDLIEDISAILKEIRSDRGNFLTLVEKLKFLNESTSVEIKKIELSNYREKIGTYLYLQVNGIYGIDSNNYDIEENYIKSIVEEHF